MKKILYILAMGAMFASCQKQDTDSVTSVSSYPADGVVRIKTDIDATKSPVTSTYLGADLGLFITNSASSEYSYFNVKWNNNSGEWESENMMLWQNAEQSVIIAAYAPYLRGSFPQTFNVQEDQTGGTLSSDLVVFNNSGFIPGKALVSNSIPITFKHVLCKLNFQFTYGSEYAGTDVTVKSVTVIADKSTTLEIDTFNEISTNSSIEFDIANIKAYKNSKDNFTVILPNQKFTHQMKMVEIELTNGRKYSYTTAVDHIFLNGNAYIIKLRIGKDKLEFNNITVNEWGDEVDLGGGEATM